MSNLYEAKIIICDDSVTNTAILAGLLEDGGYSYIDTFNDPREVIPAMTNTSYDLLLLDLEMPHMNGLELAQALCEQNVINSQFPILMLTGVSSKQMRNQALKQGILDYINKPLDFEEVLLRVNNALKLHLAFKQASDLSNNLEKTVQRRTKELNTAKNLLTKRLAEIGELKDNETGRHVLRVGSYAKLLAQQINLPTHMCEVIEYAAQLHDLGKVAIPDSILLKPGKLTPDEWEIMKTHTEKGCELLTDIDSDLARMAVVIALHHHENWDGTGYPKGLEGESIPIEARIVAICDVFDALCSKRPYKDAWSFDTAFDEVVSLSGTKFEPNLVDLFIANKSQVSQIYQNLPG